MFKNVVDLLSSASYVNLTPSNTQEMQDVFFSGDPWLVLCRGKKDGTPAPAFFKSMSLVSSTAGWINFGVMDCEKPFASGKDVYERFNLTRAPVPSSPKAQKTLAMFYVANGKPPATVPHGYYNQAERAQALLDLVVKKTKKSFKSIKSEKGLKNCLKTRYCALVSLTTASI